jgi:hypothetical protein
MSDVEVYTIKLHGSEKSYVLLAPAGSNTDKFMQDVRKLRYCNLLKREVDELDSPELATETYKKITDTF